LLKIRHMNKYDEIKSSLSDLEKELLYYITETSLYNERYN
jgi:hypothetical protein